MKLKRSVDLAGSADNPWDLALLDEHKAYVSGYNSDTIAVIDPSTGFVLETIPLPPADLFGLPSLNPAGMDIAEGRVFFACNAYDYISGAGEGMVFVVDTTTDELIDVDPSTPESVDPIRMNQFNTQDVALADSGYLFAVSVGNYWSEWSVVDVIDPAVLQLAVPDGIALGDGASATSVSPAPNGKVYFSDGMNPHIYSVDDATFEPLRTMSSAISSWFRTIRTPGTGCRRSSGSATESPTVWSSTRTTTFSSIWPRMMTQIPFLFSPKSPCTRILLSTPAPSVWISCSRPTRCIKPSSWFYSMPRPRAGT